jgi:hypothetical protein
MALGLRVLLGHGEREVHFARTGTNMAARH